MRECDEDFDDYRSISEREQGEQDYRANELRKASRMETQLATIEQTPLSIIGQAVERGADVATLEKLMDLQERYEANQGRKLYAEAMHACQQQMPSIVRDKQNTHTKTSYATLEQVQRAARPVYSANGFSLSYGEADCPVSTMKRTVCDVRHTGGHCERYHIDLPIDGIGAAGRATSMNAVQGAISTTSYGQRRLLCMIFNITLSDEDDDGEGSAVITADQVHIIEEWLASTSTNLDGFLKWAGATSLAKFPAEKYADAIAFFKRKEGKR